jgi:hypothetical protein
MITPIPTSGDERLRALLRVARPSPALPPGFQAAVWRRLEHAETASESTGATAWLDRLTAWLLRPRLALAGVTVLLLIGVSMGVLRGLSVSKDAARDRYLASVSPPGARP